LGGRISKPLQVAAFGAALGLARCGHSRDNFLHEGLRRRDRGLHCAFVNLGKDAVVIEPGRVLPP
jgi:hypothetical protein